MTTSQNPPSCRHCSSAIFRTINGFRHLFQFAWAVLVCPCFRRSWMQLLGGLEPHISSPPRPFSISVVGGRLPLFRSSVRCSLEFALRRFQESLCSSTSESSIASVSDLPSAGDNLQHQLKSVIDQVRVNSVFSAAPDNRGLSRLRSCQGKYAGRWLEALPSSRMLALKPCDFRLAASLRLGDPLPFAACVTSCKLRLCHRPQWIPSAHLQNRRRSGLGAQLCCLRLGGLCQRCRPRLQSRAQARVPEQRQSSRHRCLRHGHRGVLRTRHISRPPVEFRGLAPLSE